MTRIALQTHMEREALTALIVLRIHMVVMEVNTQPKVPPIHMLLMPLNYTTKMVIIVAN